MPNEMNLLPATVELSERDKQHLEQWAEDLIDALRGEVAKRGGALIHKPDCIVVARATPNGWLAVAQLEKVSMYGYTWRMIDGARPGVPKPPQRSTIV